MLNLKNQIDLISELYHSLLNCQDVGNITSDDKLNERAHNLLVRYNYVEESEKVTDEEETVIIVMTQHQWGKGHSLQEACENCARFDEGKEAVIIVIHSPAGIPLREDEDSLWDKCWVDGMGSIHYPEGASYSVINRDREPMKFSIN